MKGKNTNTETKQMKYIDGLVIGGWQVEDEI